MKIDRLLIHSMFDGRCAYCGKPISLKEMQVDHKEPIIRLLKYCEKRHKFVSGGKALNPNNDPRNLLPSCRPCNNWKHSLSVEDFRYSITKQVELLRKLKAGFRLIERYGLITENIKPVVFYFESHTYFNNDSISPALRSQPR